MSRTKAEADKITQEAHTTGQEMEGLQLEVKELESSVNNQKTQVMWLCSVMYSIFMWYFSIVLVNFFSTVTIVIHCSCFIVD